MTPIEHSVLHVLSAYIITAMGGGVILWALLSRPRVRWDRFWIGMALVLLVAPIAIVVTARRMADAMEAENELDGNLAGEITDTIGATWVGRHDLPLIDTTASEPLGAPFTTGDGMPFAAHEDQTER